MPATAGTHPFVIPVGLSEAEVVLEAGVTLALGSDAPVAPLDPWEAMAAAVHRSADDREEWNAGESITVAQALAGSVDGAPTIGVGSLADVVLLDADPSARGQSGKDVATHLRTLGVASTVVGGSVVFAVS